MSSTSEQNNCNAHLLAAAAEITALKQALHEKQQQLLAMESACLRESDRQVELEDSVIAWQDKYDRLYESHKRVQKVNQSLEDKLLKLVDRNTGERAQLTSDVATLSVRLAQANYNIAKLQREIERYKTDISLAIQLLQCKPDSFVPQKVSSLPIDIQSKVSSYMRLETNSHSDSEGSTSGVGVATSGTYKVLPDSDSPPPACPFPPTAMVYSMRGLDGKTSSTSNTNLNSNNGCKNNNNSNINSPVAKAKVINTASTVVTNNNIINNINNNNNNNGTITATSLAVEREMISPSTMAKFLEDELKASEVKHCDTCQCTNKDLTVLADVSHSYSVATQTPFSSTTTTVNLNEPLAALCLRCNSNLNSPSRTNSPYLIKVLKSSDSVISETKSSVSDLNDADKLFTPAKREELMVNPILGHHRLCDRTAGSGGVLHGHKFGYLTNHQSSYSSDPATKYILEPCNTPVRSCNVSRSFSRRFIDGGGTALELLELRSKYTASNLPKLDGTPAAQEVEDVEDEAKPLLSGGSQVNLREDDHSKKGELEDHDVQNSANVCEGGTRNNDVLLPPTISGSVNSLWSKTSSCEGTKMFENFNRNLIKTIKAENPKNHGPRLCAMRIQQNGQSNVLLDNMESIAAVTPIVYTRRERFLDEELDDTKDIITSKTSAIHEGKLVCSYEESLSEAQDMSNELMKLSEKEDSYTIEQNQRDILETKDSAVDVGADSGAGQGAESKGNGSEEVVSREAPPESPHEDVAEPLQASTRQSSSALNYTAAELDSDRKLTNSYRGQQNKMQLSSEQQQQVLKASLNYEVLQQNDASCKNSQKSYTQSSSISDVMDFQESLLLRRQQLSRVAEWVQNNSQQLKEQQQQQQQAAVINMRNHCGSSIEITDQQSSYSTMDQYDSVSIEKLSMDSGYKTTPQPQTNGCTGHPQDDSAKAKDELMVPKRSHSVVFGINANNNNTYFRRTGRSGLPIAFSGPAEANFATAVTLNSPEQPTCDILNYRYYPSSSDRSLSIKAELHTTTQHVDIAQMEYNVKQFLLKQNEWSIRNSRSSKSSCTNISNATALKYSKCSNAANKQQQQPQITPKTLIQSKLFSGTGIGPGIGERVRVATVAATVPSTATISKGTATVAAASEQDQQRQTPHRTETNL